MNRDPYKHPADEFLEASRADYAALAGNVLASALFGIGLLRPALTKQQRLLKRLDESERTYNKRLASPEVAAAERKRIRRAERLKRIAK